MPTLDSISGNLFSTQKTWGQSSLYEPKTIIVPFKPVPQSQAEALYDQKVNKQEKVQQLREMGFPQEELNFLLTMNDWGEIHVNPSKKTIIIGDLNGNRTETTYNSKWQPVKTVQYYENKKFVEEYKNGFRYFTEYQKNEKGQYIKKHYEKNPEDNPTKILEQQNY